MSKLSRTLNELERRANNLQSWESQGYEAPHMRHADQVQSPILNPQATIRQAPSGFGDSGAGSAAQFDITVQRINTNYAGALPYCLFAPVHAEQGYTKFITAPSGYKLSVLGGRPTMMISGNSVVTPDVALPAAVTQAMNTSLVFAYINTTTPANSDYIIVSCNQVAYPTFLAANMTDVFNMSKIRYSISDATLTSQFSQPLKVVTQSIFGTYNEQSLSVGAYKTPGQFQTDIIDVNGSFDADKETALVSNIINTNNFISTFSIFVRRYDKLTRSEMFPR